MGVFRMDRRKAAAHIEAFEVGIDDWIEILISTENKEGTPLDMQVDMTLQADRSGQPDSGRNDQTAASLFRQRVNGVGKSIGIEGAAVTDAAEINKRNTSGRDGREGNAGHLKREALVQGVQVGTFFARTSGCKGDCGKEDGNFSHRLRTE